MTMQKYAYFFMTMIGASSFATQEVTYSGPLKNKVLHNLDGIFIKEDAIEDIIRLYQWLTKKINELDIVMAEEIKGLDTHHELNRLKTEFEEKTLQFIHIARVVKAWMIKLIEEWAVLHNRQDTLLALWTTMPNSNEHEFIKEQITNTTQLRAFLCDLRSFLGDLVQSCTKGYNAFLRSQPKRQS